MLTHHQLWTALDMLAKRHGLSASGLAKRAGLDPTTFNKSKRKAADGKPRWPSTESVAKVLAATGEDFAAFAAQASRKGRAARSAIVSVPLIGLAQAGNDGYFDDAGFPVGGGWDDIPFPDVTDEHAYALEIAGDSMQPVYRDGDRIVVSPGANVRRGDRVVVKTVDGEVLAKMVGRVTTQKVELKSFNPAYDDRVFAMADIVFMHRILWSSQ